MLIFQVHAQLTNEQVRAHLPGYHAELINAILSSENPTATLSRVKATLDELSASVPIECFNPIKYATAYSKELTYALVKQPEQFARLFKGTPTKQWVHMTSLFYIKNFVEAFLQVPDKICELLESVGGDEGVLFFLSEKEISRWFLQDIKRGMQTFQILKEINQKRQKTLLDSEPYSVFYELFYGRVGKLFALHTSEIIEIVRYTGGHCESINALSQLGDGVAARTFEKTPGVFVRIAKALGKNTAYGFIASNNPRIADMIQNSPDLLVSRLEEINGIGIASVSAIDALRQPVAAELFEKNFEYFLKFAKATGIECNYAFECMENREMTAFAIQKPEYLLGVISGITDKYKDMSRIIFDLLKNDDIAAFFVKDPQAAIDAIGKLLNGVETDYTPILYNSVIRKAFVKNPEDVYDCIKTAVASAGPRGAWVPNAIGIENSAIGKVFLSDPELVGESAKKTLNVFRLIVNIMDSDAKDDLSAFCNKNPKKVLEELVELYDMCSSSAIYPIFSLLTRGTNFPVQQNKYANMFAKVCAGEIPLERFYIRTLSESNSAIELGRPLDDLHAQDAERKKYLAKLGDDEVFALLLCPPQYFYTSTNHLLFDRLITRMEKEDETLTDLFKEKDLSETEQCRNLLIRAIQYDRLHGKQDSVVKNADELSDVLETLLAPIENNVFDRNYYFLLASSIEGLKNEKNIADAFRKRMRKRLGDILITVPLKPQPPEIRKALECILYQLEPDSDLIPPTAKKKLNGILEKDIYDPSHYCSSDGRLTILQIFDKKDTGNDHWNMSNDWFHKYAPPKKGEDGENIYDFPIGLGYRDSPKNARVIHFMGETPEKNQEFIKKMLQDYPNMIISFRGHSYSLNRSFPDDIFGNSTGHILFIPGSCGSSGAIPNYIANNPKTDIRFIANTSTGKGQVTNQIVEILFTSGREFKSSGSDFYITAMDSFEDLIMKNAEKLEKQGGNPSTIKAWSPGEILLNYVQTP